eukprot:3545403-Pyramimonas_sp.AAC.1
MFTLTRFQRGPYPYHPLCSPYHPLYSPYHPLCSPYHPLCSRFAFSPQYPMATRRNSNGESNLWHPTAHANVFMEDKPVETKRTNRIKKPPRSSIFGALGQAPEPAAPQ